MAFAAARMIKDKKDQDMKQKRSIECINNAKQRSKLNIPSPLPWSGSNSSLKSGLSDLSSARAGRYRASPPGKIPPCRTGVKCVKKVKGKSGKPDRIELIVTVDTDNLQLTEEQIAEYKELFQLFDKDEDGVLSFTELGVAINTLGQRHSEQKLLKMVRSVSEDKLYNTIEFNEFLQMMSKQEEDEINIVSLMDAFQLFDKDGDGFLRVEELQKIMASSTAKMSSKEMVDMVQEINADDKGCMNYKDFCSVLCHNGT